MKPSDTKSAILEDFVKGKCNYSKLSIMKPIWGKVFQLVHHKFESRESYQPDPSYIQPQHHPIITDP